MTLAALDLQEILGGVDHAPTAADHAPTTPKCRPKGNKELFPRSSTNEKIFPILEFFEKLLKAEWSKAMANRVSKLHFKIITILYQWGFAGAPCWNSVTVLKSSGALLEDGQGSIRESLDKRANFALRKAHKAVAMVIRASATASLGPTYLTGVCCREGKGL